MEVVHALSSMEIGGRLSAFLAREGRGFAVVVLPSEERGLALLRWAGVLKGREIRHGSRRVHVLWEIEHGFSFEEAELVLFHESWLLSDALKNFCLPTLGIAIHAAPA